MTLGAPSFSQIKAKVTAIRQKIPNADVIGIHSPGRWTDKSRWSEGSYEFAISQCDSPLAFRIALREPLPDGVTKVLITNLHDQDLGEDVLLRLAKRRLQEIDPWQIVRSLFDAHAVDPRLTAQPWIAEMLLESIPRDGFPAARGGFLDAETAWPLLLKSVIGMPGETPDLSTILGWSLKTENVEKLASASDEFRAGAIAWLAEKAGRVASTVLQAAASTSGTDVVPIGLAAGVIYHPEVKGRLEKASGIFETKYFGGASVSSDDVARWSTVSTEVVRGLRGTQDKEYEKAVKRADAILKEVDAEAFAYLSETSRIGFDKRLSAYGHELARIVDADKFDQLSELDALRAAIQAHDHAKHEQRRLSRVEMAARLVRWLRKQGHTDSVPQSFDQAAELHLQSGGFVDWARLSLRSGDPVRELSAAYAQLFDKVTKRRQEQSAVFAKLLGDWTAAGSKGDEVVPVEKILDTVVSPIAQKGLVLVVVVDGMSVAVARELLTDVTRHEWTEISEPGRSHNRAGLATIPSVTEYSRTSLLCGKLRQGNQEIERKQFEQHAGLLAHCRSGSPPVLFHKASLSEAEDTVLAPEVRKEIASTHRRVVGVVVNAVDDHLLKGEQIDTRWSKEEIKVLPALLHEARVARRLVVLLSDHGHVLDCQTEGRIYKDDLAGGERWRSSKGSPDEDELQVKGSRVAVSGKEVIAPWSEQVRYGIKKNGYHGGLTPMEMVAPIVVLSSTDDLPDGWGEKPADTPGWWDLSVSTDHAESTPVPALKAQTPRPKPDGMLFHMEEEQQPSVDDDETPVWISRLLACEMFVEQKRFGGRGVPTDEVFQRLLSNLDARGGKMTTPALARVLEFPAVRLPGLLAKAERVLNVDGYDVLRRDDASDTVELNRDLLLTQFDLVE